MKDIGVAAWYCHRLKTEVAAFLTGTRCMVCGKRSIATGGSDFPKDLAVAWQLSPQWAQWFIERESFRCSKCHSEKRVQFLAETIISYFNEKLQIVARDLREFCSSSDVRKLTFAEINSLGSMHGHLAALPNLHYSEYGSNDPLVPHQDLMSLTYANDSIDAVFTSETLEHVPDVDRALQEIRRILKPGGAHIFTIPVVWDRAQTVQRSRMQRETIEHLLPPSFHGDPTRNSSDMLVFYEFGSDIQERIRSIGFDLRLNIHPTNPSMSVFITEKR